MKQTLSFLGRGSFGTQAELGCTSAYYRNGSDLILIDCGWDVFKKISDLKLLDGIRKIYMCITHTHDDHIGSLGSLYYECNYVRNIDIIFCTSDKVKIFLELALRVQGIKDVKIVNHFDTRTNDSITCKTFDVKHVDTLDACGFIIDIYIHGTSNHQSTIFYTGDTVELFTEMDSWKSYYFEQEYVEVYTECSYTKNQVHLHVDELDRIPYKFRKQVFAMHCDNKAGTEVRLKGCNVVTTEFDPTEEQPFDWAWNVGR